MIAKINNQTRSLVLFNKPITKTLHHIVSSALLILTVGFSTIANAISVGVIHKFFTAPVPVGVKSIIGTICALLFSVSAYSATVQYSGATITGVSDLTVDGQVYDAIFVGGTYNQLLLDYQAPDYNTNYSAAFAELATNALYGFAITDDGFSGVSATNISGCGSTSCYLATTVSQNSLTAWSMNYQGGTFPTPTYHSYHIQPYTSWSNVTQVVWQEASVVPVPAAVWLFGSGLLGLIGIARRKKA